MPSTRMTSLFLVLVSYHIITMCNVLAEDPFTYEDLMEFTGGDFCAKNDTNLFKELCTHLAKVKGIESYKPMDYDQFCLKRQVEIRSSKKRRNEYPEIPLLSCTFNAGIEGHNKEAPTIYSALGKGRQGNDVAEYSFPYGTDKMDWQPVAIHTDFFDGLVPFTYEELENDFTGENFCLRSDKKLFKAMCTHLGEISSIGHYETMTFIDDCLNVVVQVWSSEKKIYIYPPMPLLWCQFSYTVKGELILVHRALGKGLREKDVAEYSFTPETGSKDWQPVAKHSNFLNEVQV